MIWRLALATFLTLCLCAVGQTPRAQFNGCAAGFCTPASIAGGAFTAPGDITAFTVWWGMRAYSAATRGTKAINVCDDTGANCSDVNTDGTTGALNNPGTHGANNCNTSDTCLIAKFYDKPGTNDMTTATPSFMPILVHNVLNSSYAAKCNSSTHKLLSTSNLGYGQPYSASFVAERTSGIGFSTVFSSDISGNFQVGFSNSANNALIYAGTVVSVPSVNDNVFHAANVGAPSGGATTIYQIDALTGTVNIGATGMGAGSAALCQTGIDTNNLTGFILEVGVLNTQISAGTATSLNTNQHAAYGGF